MLDRDLAKLYGVETRVLKQAVRRNLNRFPEDFMFELSHEEFSNWRSHFVTSNADRQGLRHMPMAFTEHGVLMLSSVLRSDRAIEMNIQIMRIFAKMRRMLTMQNEVLSKIEKIEGKIQDHDKEIKTLFEYLKKLMTESIRKENQSERKRIGFQKDCALER
jgi:uncharacterized membrane-anchored protein YjiN (DUF445 family)